MTNESKAGNQGMGFVGEIPMPEKDLEQMNVALDRAIEVRTQDEKWSRPIDDPELPTARDYIRLNLLPFLHFAYQVSGGRWKQISMGMLIIKLDEGQMNETFWKTGEARQNQQSVFSPLIRGLRSYGVPTSNVPRDILGDALSILQTGRTIRENSPRKIGRYNDNLTLTDSERAALDKASGGHANFNRPRR